MSKKSKVVTRPDSEGPLCPGSALFRLVELVAADVARDLENQHDAPRAGAATAVPKPTRRKTSCRRS